MRNHERELRIRRFYNQIDPAKAISFDANVEAGELGPAVYVETLHADGFDVPRRALQHALARMATSDRYFFSGMRGAGKTTELRRLQADLSASGDWVVFFTDLSQYLPLNAAVEIGDFLLVVVSAFADEVNRRYGQAFTQAGPLERFVNFLRSDIQIEGLEWSIDTLLGDVGVKAKIKDNPLFKQELQRVTRGRIDRVVAASRAFVDEVVVFVKSRSRAVSPRTLEADVRLLLIVDSVERLQGIGDEAKRVFDSVENLFNAHRDKLRFNTLDVIYSVPPHISAMAAAGAGRVFTLSMVRVFERPTSSGHGVVSEAGIRKMLDVLDRRSGEWRDLIAETEMRELARVSGGDIRELFSLARETLNLLDPDNAEHFPAPPAAIEQCKKLRRNQFGTIPGEHMAWLKRVERSHSHGLEHAEGLGTLAQLLDGKLLLQYRNGDNWYEVHPLLWDAVDRYAGS